MAALESSLHSSADPGILQAGSDCSAAGHERDVLVDSNALCTKQDSGVTIRALVDEVQPQTRRL